MKLNFTTLALLLAAALAFFSHTPKGGPICGEECPNCKDEATHHKGHCIEQGKHSRHKGSCGHRWPNR